MEAYRNMDIRFLTPHPYIIYESGLGAKGLGAKGYALRKLCA